ncbi:MAG: hypothetical protein RLZZ440_1524 [Planctomycetota bacterium]
MTGGEAWGLLVLLLSGFAAGGINAIAGGGTILTFAVLSAILPPDPGRLVAANVTSKIGIWPGAVAAAWAYRGSREAQPAWARWLLWPSGVGAVIGVGLLRVLPKESFDAVVPWLILLAAALFAMQPQLTRLALAIVRRQESASKAGDPPEHSLPAGRFAFVFALQLLVGIYGGYFGAGIGILMLGTLALLGLGDIHAVNASKNLLGAVVNGVAGGVLVAAAVAGGFRVSWLHAGILAAGSIAGGIVIGHAAQRLPAAAVRRLVAIIAFALAGYHLWREWTG